MVLVWIVICTFGISAISWLGLVLLYIKKEFLQRILTPLIAFSAGSLIGGAFIHLIPESLHKANSPEIVFLWLFFGFLLFFMVEQFLNWHRARHISPHMENNEGHHHASLGSNGKVKSSASYLILIADGIHNFIGGLAIGSSFLVSVNVGIITLIAAAAHEVPQEFGDFGILVHGGWKRKNALWSNFFSALSIVPGGILAFYLSNSIDTTLMLAFAAGNFIYLAASDLIPEITHGQTHELVKGKYSLKKRFLYIALFLIGFGIIYLTRLIFHK